MRLIDVRHLGRERVICCVARRRLPRRPRARRRRIDGLLAGLGGEVPERSCSRTSTSTTPARAGALVRALARTSRCGSTSAARRTSPTRRSSSPARRGSTATTWSGCGARSCRCPQERLRVLPGGETLGGWRVAYTPGHASHHVSYLHEPTRHGVRRRHRRRARSASGPVLAPTPPPDIDLEAWQRSIDLIAALGAERARGHALRRVRRRRRAPRGAARAACGDWRRPGRGASTRTAFVERRSAPRSPSRTRRRDAPPPTSRRCRRETLYAGLGTRALRRVASSAG